jgi:predicted unusual protein kinase regulating ubiquinone biosynthesis (AarF/ABC1/UbiB family)
MTPRDASRPMADRVGRGQKLGRVVAGHAVRSTAARLSAPLRSEDAIARKRDEAILRFADELVTVIGSMKGAALKLGQMLSMFDVGLSSPATREAFAARLAPLFDNAPAVDDAVMLSVLDAQLDKSARARLSVTPTPVAAASIGQVYRGTLDGHREVAIKIQYPDIGSAVRADLKNLALVIRLGRGRLPGVDLDPIVAEVSRRVLAELDYRTELVNHVRMYEFYRDHPAWRIPEPIAEVSTDRVLVTEYLDGTTFAEAVDLPVADRDRIGEAVYRFYCGGVYDLGEFCADPHPGNVLVMSDGKLGFLDFGLYLRMAPDDVSLQRNAFRALVEGRDADVYQMIVDAGFIADPAAMPLQDAAQYMRSVAGWHLDPEPVTVTSDLARRVFASAVLPGSGHFGQIRQQNLLDTHAFSRRTEMSVCALLGQLGATAPWGSIAREWIYETAPPATPMGESIAQWRRKNPG